jgi:3-methyladenine DNA glycosylase AlkC
MKVLLKDILFNPEKVLLLSKEIKAVYPKFKEDKFFLAVTAEFSKLELKGRLSWIAQCLREFLPHDYKVAIAIILKALPAPNNPELFDDDFGDFIYAPYADFVAKYGCSKEYLEESLNALYEITQRFSAEDAIRFFINNYPNKTLKYLLKWTQDSHYHVRRLCSEATRPKLPWSQKLIISHHDTLPILEKLYTDRTRYVTRSVSNHLNDISKIDPELVLQTLLKWQKSNKQNEKEMDYIVRHSLRTLIKLGNKQALSLLGFSSKLKISITKFSVPKDVKLNSYLEFSFLLEADSDANVLIDYILYFQNKAGNLNNKKVFKISKLALKKSKKVLINKKHLLRSDTTTRKLHCGKHAVELQINGQRMGKKFFILE